MPAFGRATSAPPKGAGAVILDVARPGACRDGRVAACHRVPRLFETGAIPRGGGRRVRMLKALAWTALLVLDDWGLAVLTSSERRDLLEIFEDRNGRGSTIVTSRLPFEHWHDAIGNPTLANSILDRLVHNARRLTLTGESMRLRDGMAAAAASWLHFLDQGDAWQPLEMPIAGQNRCAMGTGRCKDDGVGNSEPVLPARFCRGQCDLGIERNNVADLRERDDLIRLVLADLAAQPFRQL
jgi:hypothetical protein